MQEIIRQHFGYWPSFHDAEITKVTCEANPGYQASVTFVIAAFEATTEVDEEGYYKQTKQCRCTCNSSVGLAAIIVAEETIVLKLTPTKREGCFNKRTPDSA